MVNSIFRYLPVFSSKCRYLPVNATGMENTHICRHFANLDGRSHTRSPGISIMRVDSWELPLSAIPLCQLLPSYLGPPRPTLSINLYVKGCLDCTVGAFHMSIPVEPSLFQYVQSSMPSRASSSVDLMVAVSCGLTLQICLIIALSFRCRRKRQDFVTDQVSLAWSIALCTHELYTRPRVLKERWREERTGFSSLNFFQAVFTRVVVESSQPPAAKSMSPR